MKKEDLIAMGLTEEQATKVMESLDGSYIPKTRFNEVNEENKTLKQSVSDRDKQLEELKKSSGDNEELKKQIETLQAENDRIAKEKEAEIKELKLSSAIKQSLGDAAQDADLVSTLLDRTKMILGDDGKVTGLDEQIKFIKESKPFLFKTEDTQKPGFRLGAPKTQEQQKLETKDGVVDMKSAIQAQLQAQMPQTN